jgi:hypothetical protein
MDLRFQDRRTFVIHLQTFVISLPATGGKKIPLRPPPCSRLAILDRPLYFRRRCGFTAAAAFDQPSR